MNQQPAFIQGWNGALEAAATAEGRRGFRITAARLRALKIGEPAKAATSVEPRWRGANERGRACLR